MRHSLLWPQIALLGKGRVQPPIDNALLLQECGQATLITTPTLTKQTLIYSLLDTAMSAAHNGHLGLPLYTVHRGTPLLAPLVSDDRGFSVPTEPRQTTMM